MYVIGLLLTVFVATSMGQGNNTNTNTTINTGNGSTTNTGNESTTNAGNGSTTNTGTGSTTKPLDGSTSRNTNFGFDCRRSAGSCNNKSCDLYTAKCDCGTGKFNYNCEDNNPDSSTCSPACLNGGVCNGGQCVCTENFYGTNCYLTRVIVLCKHQTMLVNINPIGNFSGTIYVQGHQPSCEFKLSSIPADVAAHFEPEVDNYPGLEGHWRELQFNDPDCGGANVTDSGQGPVYLFKIYVQYMNLCKSSVDQIVLAQCVVTNGTVNVSSTDVSSVTDATDNLGEVNADGKIDAVNLKVLESDNKSPADSVKLGDVINLSFTMPISNSSSYTDFRLDVCIANNTLDGSERKTLVIVRNGCPSEEAKSIFAGMLEKTTKPGASVEIIIKLKAFIFVGPSQFLGFTCIVALCTKEKPDACSLPTNCPGFSSATSQVSPDPGSSNSSATNQPTRRKRDTASAAKEDTVDAATVKVVAPGQQEGTDAPPPSQSNGTNGVTCERSETCAVDQFVVAVAILGVCVFLLLVLSACLIFRLMKSKKSGPERPDHYPRPVDGVMFPRLELNNGHDDAF